MLEAWFISVFGPSIGIIAMIFLGGIAIVAIIAIAMLVITTIDKLCQ